MLLSDEKLDALERDFKNKAWKVERVFYHGINKSFLDKFRSLSVKLFGRFVRS